LICDIFQFVYFLVISSCLIYKYFFELTIDGSRGYFFSTHFFKYSLVSFKSKSKWIFFEI